MGEVYQARDTKLNRFVAVKILKPDQRVNADQQRRFIQEAQAASALNHPNIIVIHDIVSEEGSEIMIMEYVPGRTLSNLISEGGLPVSQVVNLGLQIADALCAAHAAGIIHRDLKPGNIMVTDKDRIKILDFGLAKLEAPPLSGDPDATQIEPMTMQGSIMGTLCYMSPEQAQGKHVDARSDIFSFGAVLYEMATGQRAFTGDSGITMLTSVLRDEPRMIHEITPNTPPELVQVVHRCLRKDLDERFQSMQEVYQTLEMVRQFSLAPGQISVVIPPTAAPAVVVPAKAPVAGFAKNKIWPIAAGIAFLVAGAGWFVKREKPLDAPPQVPITATPVAPAEIVDNNLVTNDSVIGMVKAKVPSTLILSQIRTSTTKFDLSPDGVIGLVASGVPESIIEVMRNPTKAPAAIASTTTAAVPSTDKGTDRQSSAKQDAPIAGVPTKESERLVTVNDGTPIALSLLDNVSMDAEEGYALHFKTASDLKASDTLVVAKGSAANGAVYSREKKKLVRGTKMNFHLASVVAVNGAKLKIRATPARKADDESYRVLDAKSAAQGAQFIGYVDGTQTLTLKLR